LLALDDDGVGCFGRLLEACAAQGMGEVAASRRTTVIQQKHILLLKVLFSLHCHGM
jgi:hypothetical protein